MRLPIIRRNTGTTIATLIVTTMHGQHGKDKTKHNTNNILLSVVVLLVVEVGNRGLVYDKLIAVVTGMIFSLGLTK